MRKLNNRTCKLTFIIGLFFFVSCSTVGIDESSSTELQPKIVGGDVAKEGRYPYAVSLQNNDWGHFCGGSLIAKDIVLTAAHCRGGNYNVVIDRFDLNKHDGDTVGVRQEVIHPKYRARSQRDNDFMLLVLDRPTTANVEPVKLNSGGSVPSNNQRVSVVGWGDTQLEEDIQILSDVLMTVDVNVMSNQSCNNVVAYLGDILDSMLCTKTHSKHACQGDSGGPLVIPGNDLNGTKDRQVGVMSWGICRANRTYPGVYARVSSAYEWIRKEVCDRSSDPPASFQCGKTFTHWTKFTSEEHGPIVCSEGLVRGMKCDHDYCDNIKLNCAKLFGVYQVTGHRWTQFFSEEGRNEGNNYRSCKENEFVTGINCRGSYCDDVSLRCSTYAEISKGRNCRWVGPFSEENNGTLFAPNDYFVTGLACYGSYCDNKKLKVCTPF